MQSKWEFRPGHKLSGEYRAIHFDSVDTKAGGNGHGKIKYWCDSKHHFQVECVGSYLGDTPLGRSAKTFGET